MVTTRGEVLVVTRVGGGEVVVAGEVKGRGSGGCKWNGKGKWKHWRKIKAADEDGSQSRLNSLQKDHSREPQVSESHEPNHHSI